MIFWFVCVNNCRKWLSEFRERHKHTPGREQPSRSIILINTPLQQRNTLTPTCFTPALSTLFKCYITGNKTLMSCQMRGRENWIMLVLKPSRSRALWAASFKRRDSKCSHGSAGESSSALCRLLSLICFQVSASTVQPHHSPAVLSTEMYNQSTTATTTTEVKHCLSLFTVTRGKISVSFWFPVQSSHWDKESVELQGRTNNYNILLPLFVF